jgi:hypothetical protein
VIVLTAPRRTLLDKVFRRGSTILTPRERLPATFLEKYGYIELRTVEASGGKANTEATITSLGREAHMVQFEPRPSVWEQMARARGLLKERKRQ